MKTNKPKVGVIFASPIFGTKHLFSPEAIKQRMIWLENLTDDYELTLISIQKKSKIIKKIEVLNLFTRVVSIDKYMKSESTEQVIENLDLSLLDSFSFCIAISEMPFSLFHRGQETEFVDHLQKYFDKNKYTFQQTRFINLKNNYVLEMCRHSKTFRLVDDPMILDYSRLEDTDCKDLYFTNSKDSSLNYCPLFEYGIIYKDKNRTKRYNKTIDLLVGIDYILRDNKNFRYSFIKEFKERQNTYNLNIKSTCRCKLLNIDEKVSRVEYDKLLTESKFTIIVPSYNEEEFSFLRYIEAIKVGCIPLIFEGCNSYIFKTQFKDLDKVNIYNVNFNNLEETIKNIDYETKINEFLTCSDWTNFTKLDYYKPFFKDNFNVDLKEKIEKKNFFTKEKIL